MDEETKTEVANDIADTATKLDEVLASSAEETSLAPDDIDPAVEEAIEAAKPEPTEYWSNKHQCMLPINPVVEVPAPPANSHWDVNAQQWVPNV